MPSCCAINGSNRSDGNVSFIPFTQSNFKYILRSFTKRARLDS